MTTQITVRLPDDLVQFTDMLVSAGQAGSRAEVVTSALTNERRRLAAERDAEIYAAAGEDPELAAFHTWAAANRPELGD